MFLGNGLTARALFYLGATQSFVSIAHIKKFGDAPGMLDYPVEVEIADDCMMSAPRDHCGCGHELFCKKYLINLFPIPIREKKIIVRMDWLS